MIKIGMIGMSQGNGHPYSFSAIVNGYDGQYMRECPYQGIYEYLSKRDESDFGISDAKVTHVWTPNPGDATLIAKASCIPNIVPDLSDMLDSVDAVIIARDDAETHWKMARPFLERGIPVFVDKPLANNLADLRNFREFLEAGSLMSCSAMRFAAELEPARKKISEIGKIRTVHCICMNDWFKYGVHLVEGAYGLLGRGIHSVRNVGEKDHNIVHVRYASDFSAVFQVIKDVSPLFRIEVFGTEGHVYIELSDLFTMFKNMLMKFVDMVNSGTPAIPPEETIEIIRLLIAANISLEDGGREVQLSEVI